MHASKCLDPVIQLYFNEPPNTAAHEQILSIVSSFTLEILVYKPPQNDWISTFC